MQYLVLYGYVKSVVGAIAFFVDDTELTNIQVRQLLCVAYSSGFS